jgi:hypothetical protein
MGAELYAFQGTAAVRHCGARSRHTAGTGGVQGPVAFAYRREGPTSLRGTPRQEPRKLGANVMDGAFVPERRRKLRRNGKRSAGV